MFNGLYYRIAFPSYVRNPNGLKRFAERCISTLIDNVKNKSSFLRQKIQEQERKLKATRAYLDTSAKADLLSDSDFFGIRRRTRIDTFIVIGIFFTEGLLNYFSTLVFISGEDLVLTLLRWLIAIILTFGAIAAASRFMEAVLPIRKHNEPNPKPRSIPMVVLWSILFIGVEIAIAGVAETRAKDIEGGRIGGLLYFGFIIFSMVLPFIAGVISWDLLHYYDSYKHTRKYNVAQRTSNAIDQRVKSSMQRLEDYYNVRLNAYWHRFNDFRSFKENYNLRREISETIDGHFCTEFGSFKEEADRRYGDILGIMEFTRGGMERREIIQ